MIRDGIIGLIMFYKGEDVLAKTHEQFVEELMEINSEIEVIGRYTKAVDRIRVKCLNCGKEWEPLAYSLLQGKSCSHCSAVRGAKTHSGKTAAKTKEAFESQLKIVDDSIQVIGEYSNTHTNITCKCERCNYIWSAKPYALLQGHGCPRCAKSGTSFMEQFIKSLREQRVSEFSSYYRNKVDVLLIDDIQNWSGKEETQNEFFHIFNALHQAGKQIVLTSDVPAVEVKSLAERLVSRFSWGLTVDIQPPDVETREAILRQKAKAQHLDIDNEVILYLAENISGNVRFLENAITKLTAQASVMHHDIDMTLARRVVNEILPTIRRRVNVNAIIQAVSQHFDIPADKLIEKGRGTQEVSKARQVAMYLTKELSTLSLQGIGQHFGGRDHATVIHANKSVKQYIETDPTFAREIETLKNNIRD